MLLVIGVGGLTLLLPIGDPVWLCTGVDGIRGGGAPTTLGELLLLDELLLLWLMTTGLLAGLEAPGG